MYKLNEQTIHTIENRFRMPIEKLKNIDVEELNAVIRGKAHNKLKFFKINDSGLLGSSSIFLYLNRFLDIDWINKKLRKI